MTTLNAKNYKASRVDEPAAKVSVKELHGRVRRMYDSITLDAELALNDVINAGVLPAGAKIIDARVIAPADSAGGQLDFGYASNGVDAADQDGLMLGAQVDFGGSALDTKMLGTAAAFNKELAAVETTLQFTCIEASTDSTGNTIQWEVFYIVD